MEILGLELLLAHIIIQRWIYDENVLRQILTNFLQKDFLKVLIMIKNVLDSTLNFGLKLKKKLIKIKN